MNRRRRAAERRKRFPRPGRRRPSARARDAVACLPNTCSRDPGSFGSKRWPEQARREGRRGPRRQQNLRPQDQWIVLNNANVQVGFWSIPSARPRRRAGEVRGEGQQLLQLVQVTVCVWNSTACPPGPLQVLLFQPLLRGRASTAPAWYGPPHRCAPERHQLPAGRSSPLLPMAVDVETSPRCLC